MEVAKTLMENSDWVPSGLRLHAITYEVAVLRVPVIKEQEPSDIAKKLMEQNQFIISDRLYMLSGRKGKQTDKSTLPSKSN